MARFPYLAAGDQPTSQMPRLPMMLAFNNRAIEVVGLLDTGAAVNVLPYPVGLALGAVWEEQTMVVSLVGSLGQAEAKALVVEASHPQITGHQTIHLAFAWTRLDNAPIIFGQMIFFLEFDVCFYRAQGVFDVQVKTVNS